MTKAELVVELGAEEIPASLLEGMAGQFARALLEGLSDERLEGALSAVWYTPRRVIVGIADIPVRQADLLETVMGPPKSIAFDSHGAPTRAALAFAEKNGLPLAKVKTVQTPKGEYLSATRKTKGRRTSDLLQRMIPEAIAKIQFPKTMHWSADRFRFARPLRWMVALFGGRALKFDIADVRASSFTVGHRFVGRPKIRVSSLSSLKDALRDNGVIVDPGERTTRICEGLAREAAASGGTLLPDEALLKTVVNLNEYPTIIRGSFETRFLDLPQEILVTVMREHQKYFSVVGPDGGLLPVFLAAVNIEAPDMQKIRQGHERVLRARLADGAFFWQTDRKTKLEERLDSLRTVLFQEKLGSYHEKTMRVLDLLPRLAEAAECGSLLSELIVAGRLAKCDLVTEMVKEFTDLQGIVGGLYARDEGYPEAVWRAIYEQYQPKAANSPSPSTLAGALLSLADRLDTICGCFSIGLIPSGSRDPFGVRRQGNGLLKILLDHRIDVSIDALIDWGLAAFGAASTEVASELKKFFEGRLRFLFDEEGYAYDCINASLSVGLKSVVDARERVRALQSTHAEPDFLSVASNFKRIMNILTQQEESPEAVDPTLMTETAERALWDCYQTVSPVVENARRKRDYTEALRLLASMRQTVDAFFDQVLVMAENPAVRANRLGLLVRLSRMFLSVADISQIVLEKADTSSR